MYLKPTFETGDENYFYMNYMVSTALVRRSGQDLILDIWEVSALVPIVKILFLLTSIGYLAQCLASTLNSFYYFYCGPTHIWSQ